MTKNYTYAIFASDVIALLNGLPTTGSKQDMIEKAEALATAQRNKAEYNANRPKKSTAKGAGEKTQALIAELVPLLSDTPKTASDFSDLLGKELSALQVANAMKFIAGAVKVKVIREVINSKGLKSQKEYTAYKLAD